MTIVKIEKIFWALVIFWFVLRGALLFCQLDGNKSPELKKQVLQYFTQKDIDQGKEYALRGFGFKVFYGYFFVFILLLGMKMQWFSRIYTSLEGKIGGSSYLTDFLYIVMFLGFIQLLSLPSSYYFGYMRESSMGFLNIGFFQWLLKFFKSAFIGIAFQTAGIYLIINLIKIFPKGWIIAVPTTMAIFSVVLTILFPLIITPLFYNQVKLDNPSLEAKIDSVAQKAGIDIEEIYVIDESRYSKHTNAYFTGIGKHRRIVLYDNLLKSNTEEETMLIFAHEAGHWLHNHVFKGLSLGFLGMLCITLFVNFVFPYLKVVPWFGLRELSSAGNIPFFFTMVILFQLFTAPIESQISQYMERQADSASVTLTGLVKPCIDAEIKLARDNKSDLLPHPFRVFWLYSHPPIIDRIKMAEEHKKTPG